MIVILFSLSSRSTKNKDTARVLVRTYGSYAVWVYTRSRPRLSKVITHASDKGGDSINATAITVRPSAGRQTDASKEIMRRVKKANKRIRAGNPPQKSELC